MDRKRYLLAVVVVSLVLGAGVTLALDRLAGAAPPGGEAAGSLAAASISYQGVLNDSSGAAVSGTHSIRFAIYTATAGLEPIWAETQTVNVDSGLFAVYLGDANPLTTTVFNGQELYLGVRVASDEEMTPRLRIGAVPYAFAAACELTEWYKDADGDGYGDAGTTTQACVPPPGYTADSTDCDDGNVSVNPGATEVCNSIDDDCDGAIDEEGASGCTLYYTDQDGDGWGGTLVGCLCEPCPGCLTNGDDCDDTDAQVFPGATEICDGIDNDCDLEIDEGGVCG